MKNPFHILRIPLLPLVGLLAIPLAGLAQSTANPQIDTLERIQSTKTIRLGLRNSAPPFAWIDEGGKPHGFTWELCNAVVRELSTHLKTPIAIDLVPVSLAQSFEYLGNGRIDMQCGSTTHNVEREARIDFSYTFFVAGIVVAYRSSEPRFAAPNAFGRVGALQGSTAEKAVTARAATTGEQNYVGLTPFKSYAEGVEMLKAGKVDTLAADGPLLPPDPAISVRQQRITIEPYALMMRKGDTAFVKTVDSALATIMRSPEIAKFAERAKLRVDYMTREIWRHPDRSPAPPQF